MIRDILLKGIIPLAIGIPIMIMLPVEILSWVMVFLSGITAWFIGVAVLASFLTIAHYYRHAIRRRMPC